VYFEDQQTSASLLWRSLLFAPPKLSAQSDEMYESLSVHRTLDPEIDNPNGQDRGNCGGRLGDYGEKLLNCEMPARLPLNKRGVAWLKFGSPHRLPGQSAHKWRYRHC
jgi:hypothetical protein